ncbi:MAG: hypothetical protein LAP39_28280 [Acidobacteriia bacterium]|nr:hypothetical protein [Terriglobia bacterium]
MDQSFLPWTPIVAGIVPATISGVITYLLTRSNFRRELEKVRAGQISTLRKEHVSPLRYWASKLSRRLLEIEGKFEKSDYSWVQKCFKAIKDHADGSKRMNGFPVWCYYEGIFAMTTLYYTCSYIQCSREMRFRLPFSELDPDYSSHMDAHVETVSLALGGIEGIWDSSQEVLGERFTASGAKMDNDELCRIIDSQDEFKIAPFIRLLDFYIEKLDLSRARGIRLALDDLIRFLDSRRPPEMRL